MNKSRIKYLDIARGLAMMMVIAGHIIQPEILGNTLRYYLFAVHLPLFLIISGILFKEKNYKNLLTKNISKLILPYLIGVLLTILMFIIEYYQPWSSFLHYVVVKNLNSVSQTVLASILVNGGDYYAFLPQFGVKIGAIWYLVAYFEASFLFNAIIKFVRSRISQIIIIIALTGLGYGIGIYTALPFQILSALVMLPFLGAGYYTKKYWLDASQCNLKIDVGLSIIGVILWVLSAQKGILLLVSAEATQGPILGTVAGIMGSFALLIWIRKLENITWFKFFIPLSIQIGQVSLMMLVVHTLDLNVFPLSAWTMKVLHIFIHSEALVNYIAMFTAIIYAFIGAIILQFIFDKTEAYIKNNLKFI
ncbi:acyltransferase family protein [Weissella koreensis]|uniref:acyltransferase family protein n=1 Tax=Weissella koreensis TaxID=165096 RepID=UPI0009DAA196|nr:acyltransferase family protein [Weissella koreensis]